MSLSDSQSTIASRFLQLNKLLLGKSSLDIPNKYLVQRDGLLDILFALYEECNVDYLRKDKRIGSFVNKFKGIVTELKSLRVNPRDFEAKKIIGRGHFGEVQVVREKGSGDVYAMKVLRKQETLSHQNVAFYEEERDIMAKSCSPWITKLQYAFQDNQNLYLIMEFHPGGDILSLLERYDNVLPEQMAQFYLSELVLAIQSVHTMGYVHRDVKPDNILIDRTGHIKLADFGSAAKLNALKQVTSTMPVGTPDYVAPEVLSAMNNGPVLSKSYSVECDWWSLGIVAFEMLFGCTPFSDEKVLMTYSNIMSFKKSLKFPEEASEVSENFIAVIKGLLQDSSNRLGYDELIAHPLFSDIDWNNLRHTVPPFVPNVTSVDDTSNFDEFEPESRPCRGELSSKKEFSGKNLPFVGFTFTSPFETFAERFSSSHNSTGSPMFFSADSDVFSKRSELMELQSKLSDMSVYDAELKSKIEELENNLQSTIKELESSKIEKETLEQLLDEQKLEVKEVKRLLSYERQHREITEQKASQIVSCMKARQRQDALKHKSRYSESGKKECDIEIRLEEALYKQDELVREKSVLEMELNEVRKAMQGSENKKIMAEKEYNGLLKLVKKIEAKNIELENEISRNSSRFESGDNDKSLLIRDLEGKLENEQINITEFEQQMKALKEELCSLNKSKADLEKCVKELRDQQSDQSKEKEALKYSCDTLNLELKQLKQSLVLEKNRVLESLKTKSSFENAILKSNLKAVEDSSKVEEMSLKATSRVEDKSNKENISDIIGQLKEKEDLISNVNLKLRISERKKQQAEEMTASLRESNRNLREKFSAAEKNINQMTITENELKEKIETLEQGIVQKQQEIQDNETLYKIEKAKLKERIKAVQDTCENTKDICHQYSKSQGQYEEITRHNELLKKDLEDKTGSVMKLEGDMKNLKQSLYKKENECSKYERTVKILKETSLEMEDELKEMENLVEARDKIISELKIKNAQLKKEMENFDGDLRHVNSCLNKEKKMREALEEQLREISSELENQQSLNEAELQSVQEHLEYYKKLTADLEAQLSGLEKELSMEDRNIKKYSERNATLEAQLMEIKEEATKHITQISSLKASNMKLTQALDNALENQIDAQHSFDQLQNEFEGEKVNYAYEKVKLQETLSQQTKLIDFLQSKAENMEKKKKNNISRLFGKKDPIPNPSSQFRDLENILEKEKVRCRRLQDQLSRARAENMALRKDHNKLSSTTPVCVTEVPVSPTSRAMHSVITSSPCPKEDLLSPETKYVKPQGMKHKIPHRFNEVMCMKSSKCCACLDSIHFGRLLAKCQECSVVCHPKCATSLPSTCGLPTGFMQHFKTVIRKNTLPFSPENTEQKASEGWVKLPKSSKQGWERRYLRFIDDTLYVFEDSEEIDPVNSLESFDFKSSEAQIIITSAVSATELTYAANSDLPYVLKVECIPHTTCWPQKSLCIMAPNFGEKQMWVSTLEEAVNKNLSKSEISQDKKKLLSHSILTLKGEEQIDTHCIFALDDDIMILGAVEGLFLLHDVDEFTCSMKGKIDGINSVYQIESLRSINCIVLIEGENRSLKVIEIDTFRKDITDFHIESSHVKPIANANNCHLFSVDEVNTKESPYLCTATAHAVTLYKWDTMINFFGIQKVVETREPCSCILFTANSAIFGAEKFYELDTKTFAVEDFLDSSDSSLAGLVYGASQFQSYPVAIFQVAMKYHEEEYLVCFHELGVFVDGFGQRTRSEDMKWSRLPLSFAYREPFLFVTHFTSVEVIEIPLPDASPNGAPSILQIPNPQYLGPGSTKDSVYISSSSSQSIEILLVNGKPKECTNLSHAFCSDSSISISSSLLTKSSQAESEDLDFSFNTSINQSLDDLSETLLSKTSGES